MKCPVETENDADVDDELVIVIGLSGVQFRE